jgi:hypothetical protein
MIPKAYIIEWSKTAPWLNNSQVEQDLIIERALVEIFSDNKLKKHLCQLKKFLLKQGKEQGILCY